MDLVNQIKAKANGIFIDLGFEEVIVDHYMAGKKETNFLLGNLYCCIEYVDSLGFIVQYARSLYEAQCYAYEDGDSFPLHLGEDAILEGIRIELQEVIKDEKIA